MAELRYSERNLLDAVRSGKTASTAEVEIVLERLGRLRERQREVDAALRDFFAVFRRWDLPTTTWQGVNEQWDKVREAERKLEQLTAATTEQEPVENG